jgi:hypothetical protein
MRRVPLREGIVGARLRRLQDLPDLRGTLRTLRATLFFYLLLSFSLLYTTAMAAQPLLLFESICSCGIGPVEKAGMCLPCYRQRWHSLRRFGGHREEVLARDGHRCRVCVGDADLVVHHRALVQDIDWMITLCAGCHARVHRSLVLTHWVPELLLALWVEAHPDRPEQLQLLLAA